MPSEPCRVLIVEDDDDIRETLTDALECEGHAVLSARDGAEALQLIQGGASPGIILLDLMLPVMNGWELSRKLGAHERHRQIPIVIVSAVDPHRLPELRARAVVPKPFDLGELLSVIDQHCIRPVAKASTARM